MRFIFDHRLPGVLRALLLLEKLFRAFAPGLNLNSRQLLLDGDNAGTPGWRQCRDNMLRV
jgi:hypothetical protein